MSHPSEARAGKLGATSTVETPTYVPPANTLEQVLYGGRQVNETPIGMFESATRRSKAQHAGADPKNPTLHRFRGEGGELNTRKGDRSMRRRGPHYALIIDALRAHGPLTINELAKLLDGQVPKVKLSDALSIMGKHGEVERTGTGARTGHRWRLTG